GDHLAQTNLCFFHAMANMQLGDGTSERQSFAQLNKQCLDKITAPPRPDVAFYAVPHGGLTARPFEAMKSMVAGAQNSIKVAIHRLTTRAVTELFSGRSTQGLDVAFVFDDDTFRTSKCNGGPALDVAVHDVNAYFTLRSADVDVSFVETN